MSHKTIHKCDSCGVEITDEHDDASGLPRILRAGLRRRTDSWGNLSVSTGDTPFGASFDLCEGCIKRVLAVLELELPKPEAIARRLGGLGGHATWAPPGEFFGPGNRMAPPWSSPLNPYDGGLTPEDLKELGIELPPGMFTRPTPNACSKCGVPSKGPAQGPCPMCGHVN